MYTVRGSRARRLRCELSTTMGSHEQTMCELIGPDNYEMVYQGTGAHARGGQQIGSFGAGPCCIIAITTPDDDNYVAHVDAVTQYNNPLVFHEIRRMALKANAQIYITPSTDENEKCRREVVEAIPEGKRASITYGGESSSLAVDGRNQVVFDVPPTKRAKTDVLDQAKEKGLTHMAARREYYERQLQSRVKPDPPGKDYWFDATAWHWKKR